METQALAVVLARWDH